MLLTVSDFLHSQNSEKSNCREEIELYLPLYVIDNYCSKTGLDDIVREASVDDRVSGIETTGGITISDSTIIIVYNSSMILFEKFPDVPYLRNFLVYFQTQQQMERFAQCYADILGLEGVGVTGSANAILMNYKPGYSIDGLPYSVTCFVNQWEYCIEKVDTIVSTPSDDFYSSDPYLDDVLLIVTSVGNMDTTLIGSFYFSESKLSFNFSLVDVNNQSTISYSDGLVLDDNPMMILESLEDNSVSYMYDFNWSYMNSYNTKTGQCSMSLSFEPKDKSFNLIMKCDGEEMKYSGIYISKGKPNFSSTTVSLGSTIRDNENNSYGTVQIGNQTWTTSNLKVTHFSNGDTIWHAKSMEDWFEAGEKGIPAWCFSENDPNTKDEFGILYNWYAINDPRGLAPYGWHIPSKSEFEELISYLGGDNLAPSKIKGVNGWENSKHNNESKLNGVQTGMRMDCVDSNNDFKGCYSGSCHTLSWWSSSSYENSKYPDKYAYYLSILDTDDQILQLISSQSRKYGSSVRLVKN